MSSTRIYEEKNDKTRVYLEHKHNKILLYKKIHRSLWNKVRMAPDRDTKGPRKRSPRPSKKKGGRRQGDC